MGARSSHQGAHLHQGSITRRRMLLAGAVPAAALGATACGRSAQGPQAASKQVSGTVTYWHWGSQEYNERERRIADAFQEKFPAVTVETVNPGSLTEKLIAAFAGGTPPDTFAMDLQVVQMWGENDVLQDLNDLIKKDPSYTLGSYKTGPISKLMFEIMSYQGKLLAHPSETSPNVYFYNADLFRQAGLKTPYELWREDRWTWDEFVNAVLRLTKRGADGSWELVGASVGTGSNDNHLWIESAGGRPFDDFKKPTKCLYDEPPAIEGLQFLQDLKYKHRGTPLNRFSAEVGMNEDQAFMAGRLALRARWTTGIGLYKSITSFKWGVVPYPKRKTYAYDYATGGPTSTAMAKETKVREAAWEWIKFKAGPEGLKVFAQDGTGVPYHEEAQKVLLEVHKSIPTFETPGLPVEILKQPYQFVRLLSKDQDKIWRDYINPELQKIWNNEEGAAAAARRIAAAVNEFLKANPQ